MNNILKCSTLAIAALTLVLSGCSSAGQTQAPTSADSSVSAQKTYASTAEVLAAVQAAQTITALPDSVAATLTAKHTWAPEVYFNCKSVNNPSGAVPFGECAYGDKNGNKTMVVYGDSHAAMWAASLEGVAAKNGYKLRVFGLGGCPVLDLQFQSSQSNSPNDKCDQFHTTAVEEILAIKPDVIFATSVSDQKLRDGASPTSDQWREGWIGALKKLGASGARLSVIGSIPSWQNSDPKCLAAHTRSIQDCSVQTSEALPANMEAEIAASESAGALYVDPIKWVCAERCVPVIADTLVYFNPYHLTEAYAQYLTGAVEDAVRPVLS